MDILVTGGAGFIGSHTVIELINAGHNITIIDNLINSKQAVIGRIGEITGTVPEFIRADLLDSTALDRIFASRSYGAVIHFAALKAVGESVQKPLLYYQNNVTGTIQLLQAMAKSGVKNLVFSSSASVYGQPASTRVTEASPTIPTNPYGQSKLMCEQLMKSLHISDPSWNLILLRYFNPVGAHASGKIGEDPQGTPNNLAPYIARVAGGKLKELSIFGNDYPTVDGTGVRDYIHVTDVATGHLKALDKLEQHPGYAIYNLGTGHGASVLEMLHAFETACGHPIPFRIENRRPGDPAEYFADPSKAESELKWKAVKTLADMCTDTWRWQSQNPDGFPDI